MHRFRILYVTLGGHSSYYCPVLGELPLYKIELQDMGERRSKNMERFGEKVKRSQLEYHQNRNYYSLLISCKTGAQRTKCSHSP